MNMAIGDIVSTRPLRLPGGWGFFQGSDSRSVQYRRGCDSLSIEAGGAPKTLVKLRVTRKGRQSLAVSGFFDLCTPLFEVYSSMVERLAVESEIRAGAIQAVRDSKLLSDGEGRRCAGDALGDDGGGMTLVVTREVEDAMAACVAFMRATGASSVAFPPDDLRFMVCVARPRSPIRQVEVSAYADGVLEVKAYPGQAEGEAEAVYAAAFRLMQERR